MKENILEKTKDILKNMSKDHISESAAQCAYYVILSFIPFLILLLTLIQYTHIDSEELLEILTNIIPSNMNGFVIGIVREVYSKSLGTISISIIFTLISAGKGLFALTKELHTIYNSSSQNKKSWIYLKIASVIETIIFIVLLVIGMVLLVFGKTIVSTAKEHLGLFENYTIISSILYRSLFILIAFVIFLFMYKFMSRHKLRLKSQIKGAIFSSLLLNIVSFVFSRYLNIFKGFSSTYGSLTTLMLIMMWTYTCFYVIFLGAEINKIAN
ncbi:MAG: YihY/virulence factor BrkB family protein [Clostridia bacterium]|nr:YihY/virulence factor BrkB family protein [Clostridia bacterium]